MFLRQAAGQRQGFLRISRLKDSQLAARARQIAQLQQHFGTGWVLYRLMHAARMKSGLMRRQTPVVAWHDRSFSTLLRHAALADPRAYLAYRCNQAPTFFFSGGEVAALQPHLTRYDTPVNNPNRAADELQAGELTYFSGRRAAIGNPPRWHHNPFSGQTLPTEPHWSQLSDFAYGDIKLIWEPSRFGWVYPLVRAYWRSKDERYAALFWQWVEDWMRHNRPNQGPNWKCGQETSLRVMALCFGLYGFLYSSETSGERLLRLLRLMAVSAERIEANLSYALSQRNNHGISEGMGLWTIGLLFPELAQAERWRARGRAVLEQQAQSLIYDDGTFSQHSVNYHRVMLDDLVWSMRLGELNDQPLSQSLYNRVALATNWLYQLLDVDSGGVPTLGQNDGAHILPLSNADYRDYRPIIQAAYFLINRRRLLPSGVWDEKLLWLFGPEATTAPRSEIAQENSSAAAGGYYTLRDAHSMIFTHCGSFRDRPAHADLLHVDLWWRGVNVALDAGTFSYNAEPPWNNPLAHTAYHNTVTVGGADQMERAGKFLWLPWATGTVHSQGDGYWEGSHDGYAHRDIIHNRAIRSLGDDSWLIVDRLTGSAPFIARLHWLLADLPYQSRDSGGLVLTTSQGDYCVTVGANRALTTELVRADAASPRGWWAPYYGCRAPTLSFSAEATATQTLFWTVFSATPVHTTWSNSTLALEFGRAHHHVTLSLDHERPIIIDSK